LRLDDDEGSTSSGASCAAATKEAAMADASSSTPATDAFASTLAASVPQAELMRLTQLQAEIHQTLRMSNEQLAAFNEESAAKHAALHAKFTRHVATLNALHADLLDVFKRIRAIRRQLLQQHPEFEAAARAADAKREAEMEAAEIALAARVEAVGLEASAPAPAEPSGDATAPT